MRRPLSPALSAADGLVACLAVVLASACAASPRAQVSAAAGPPSLDSPSASDTPSAAAPPPSTLDPPATRRCSLPPREPPPPRFDDRQRITESARCADHAPEERAIAREIASRYHRTARPSRVDVAFGCDDLSAQIDRVVLVTGHPMSRRLALVAFTRIAGDSTQIRVRALAVAMERDGDDTPTYDTAGRERVQDLDTTISAPAFERALRRVRAASSARAREIDIPPPPGAPRTAVVTVGPGSFYAGLWLTDVDGRTFAVRHDGGTTGGAQRTALGVIAATETLEALVRPLAWRTYDIRGVPPIQITDAHRDLFADAVRLDPSAVSYDWIAANYFRLARRFGRSDIATRIVALLETAPPPEHPENEPVPPLGARRWGADEVRIAAVNALAALAGFDARSDARGQPRPLQDVVTDYVRECVPAR